jgi:dGTPase
MPDDKSPIPDQRQARRYGKIGDDQRKPFERDRDRILYSSALRRLSGITQIAPAADIEVFHNRLTHTIKVAQIGRRTAQHLIRTQPQAVRFHGVNEEVVEAACLAHDLGHPPFGHIGEEALNDLVLTKNDNDGFEGNAQSFRVLTKLAVRRLEHSGLDLTRATLGACIKYPWLRDATKPERTKKWGAYSTEQEDFDFSRLGRIGVMKSAEAEIMDWSDDIAYSVHDLEDFHRCGIIPWWRIFSVSGTPTDRDLLVSNATKKWFAAPQDAKARLDRAYDRLADSFLTIGISVISEPYEGTVAQRTCLRSLTSFLIGRYVMGISLTTKGEFPASGRTVRIDDELHDEVLLLKQITRDYIISRTSLAAQQRGQKKIIGDLFGEIYADMETGAPKYVPKRFHHLCAIKGESLARRVADCVSSLTEGEALALHGRLMGYAAGTVLDPIVR